MAEDNRGYNFLEHNSSAHLDLPRFKESWIKLQFFALYIDSKYQSTGYLRHCLLMLDKYYQAVKNSRGVIETVLDQESLHRIMRGKNKGALLSIEGGEALEGELAVLRMLFRLGIRSLGLTWNFKNELASGVKGDDEGLTPFGREVIVEMNELGMLVDLAHLNAKGFFDAISTSAKPVIVSHANVKKLCDHPRNLTDDQLRSIKNINGVVGLTFYPPFIDSEKPTLDRLLDHFVYVADLIGTDYLAFGSDFDGIDKVLDGLEDVSYFPQLAENLSRRGFSSNDLEKITSKNILRVLSAVLPGKR